MPRVIVVLDNYDSFVHNLARYLVRLDKRTEVLRNDAVSVEELRALDPEAIVISPGPCTPSKAGISLDVVHELHREIPILGVCLGHQAIGQALGARISQSSPMHGRSSVLMHDGQHEFLGLPTEFEAARYHSLVIQRETIPDCLHVSAWTADGLVMAVRHVEFPTYGWQFHPESVLTPLGSRLLAQWLAEIDKYRSARLPLNSHRVTATPADQAL